MYLIIMHLYKPTLKDLVEKKSDLGKNTTLLPCNKFHQLIFPESAPLAGEKQSFHQLTSKIQDGLAGESTNVFKIKFLSHGESVLHTGIVDRHLQILIFPMVLSNMHLEFGKLVKCSLQDQASFFQKCQFIFYR